MTQKKKWKIRIVFWIISVLIAVGIGVICVLNGVSENAFHKALIAYVIIMIAIWYVINFAYVARLAKRVNLLIPILYDEGNPEKYLSELHNLIGEAKSQAFRSIYYINSAAAYCDMGEYEKARQCLGELEPKRIPGANKLAYYADLALVSVHLGEDDKAITIWNENKDKLLKFVDNRDLGPAIASLNIFSMIYFGKGQDASREIELAKQKWTRERDIREFDYMEGKLKEL